MADPRLNIRITAELTEIRRALAGLSTNLEGFKKKAETSGSALTGGLRKAGLAAAGLAATLGAGFSVAGLIAIGDEAAMLEARLRLATKTTDEFNRAQRGTYDIAQRTRTSLQATVELYGRLERSTRDLGANQATLLQLTESINQAAQLSGGGPGAEAALFQLSQGLASGQLRGEELNSVLEQTPRLAQAIADGMDVPIGKLRELAKDGKLTAKQIGDALIDQREAIAEEFDKLPLTVSGAITQVRNALVKLVGDSNTATGAQQDMARSIAELAKVLEDPSTIEAFATLGRAIAELIKLAVEGVKEFAEFGRQLGYMAARASGGVSELDEVEEQLRRVDRAMKNGFMGKPTQFLFTSDEELKKIKATLEAQRKALLDEMGFTPAKAEPAKPEPLGFTREGPTGAEEKTKKKLSSFRADLTLLRDEIDRALAGLEDQLDDGKIKLADYFAKKAELQTKAVDTALAQAREELRVADSQEDQKRALVEIEKLQRDRAEIAPKVAREQAKAEEELARTLAHVRAETAELSGDIGAVAREELKADLADALKEVGADPEAQEAIRKLFDLKGVRTELEILRGQIEETVGALHGTESLVAAQQDAGQLDPVTAEETLQALRAKSLEQLEQYRIALAALPGAANNPEIIKQLLAVDTEIARVTASQNRLVNSIKDQGTQALAGFFTALATGSKSFKDAFVDMVRSFVQGVAQMIAQELALKAVRGIMGAMGGGSVPVQHTGGMAGHGARRNLSATTMAMFAGAPRFHSGGLPGLRSDEVPAILQKGEEVLAKDNPRNIMNGGGRTGPGTGTRVINVIDPSLVQDYLDSPQGEETVLNIIGRNPGRVRQVTA